MNISLPITPSHARELIRASEQVARLTNLDLAGVPLTAGDRSQLDYYRGVLLGAAEMLTDAARAELARIEWNEKQPERRAS